MTCTSNVLRRTLFYIPHCPLDRDTWNLKFFTWWSDITHEVQWYVKCQWAVFATGFQYRQHNHYAMPLNFIYHFCLPWIYMRNSFLNTYQHHHQQHTNEIVFAIFDKIHGSHSQSQHIPFYKVWFTYRLGKKVLVFLVAADYLLPIVT